MEFIKLNKSGSPTHTINGISFYKMSAETELEPTPTVVYTLSSDGTYYIVGDKTANKGNGLTADNTATEIVIASTYNGLPVKEIGYMAFQSTTITKVVIPNSMTSIGIQAFSLCRSLTSITIPSSVTSIGSNAFFGCTGLTSIIVDSGNTTYDSRDNCNAIIETANNKLIFGCKNTVIPNGVVSIGDDAFAQSAGLTSITIPDSVTSIGTYAFSECTGLTSITIPNSVTSIGDDAFDSCTGLTSVTLGNSVTSIGSYAFYYCTSLTSITIPDSVTSIGDSAFSECEGLMSITIGNGITSIAAYMFYFCTGLTSITIPDSVTNIGEGAFVECKSLTSITIPDSVTNIGRVVFIECTELTEMTLLPTTPPTLVNTDAISDRTTKIYVPYGSLLAYKAATNWSTLDMDNGGAVTYIELREDGTKPDIIEMNL